MMFAMIDDRSFLVSLIAYCYTTFTFFLLEAKPNLLAYDYAIRDCRRPHRVVISVPEWRSVWLMNGTLSQIR